MVFVIWTVFVATLLLGQLAKSEKHSGDGSQYDAYLEGNRLFRIGDSRGAISSLRKAVDLDPSFQQAWTNLGHALLHAGEFNSAIDAHYRAHSLAPQEVKTSYNLAVALHRSNRLEDALKYYQKVVSIDDNHINALYNSALIYQDYGHIPEAMQLYKAVLKQDPLHIESRLNTCNILYAMERLGAAEQCYEDVLKVDPTYVRGLVNLAAFYSATAELLDGNDDFIDGGGCTSGSDDEDSRGDGEMEIQAAPINSGTYATTTTGGNRKHRSCINQREKLAIDLYREALRFKPDDVMALHALKALQSSCGEADYASASVSDSSISGNTDGLSSLGRDSIVKPEMSTNYVSELFDSYSFHFEQSLQKLHYQSHELVAAAVNEYYQNGSAQPQSRRSDSKEQVSFHYHDTHTQTQSHTQTQTQTGAEGQPSVLNILDLGAGTGLVCPPLRRYVEQMGQSIKEKEQLDAARMEATVPPPMISHSSGFRVNITGVDLSGKMLLKAAAKGCYDYLETADIIQYLRTAQQLPSRNVSCRCECDTGKSCSVPSSDNGDRIKSLMRESTVTAPIHDEDNSACCCCPTLQQEQEQELEQKGIDIIVAADVFMYLGDLGPVLLATWQALRPGGLLVFTVEDLHGDGSQQRDNQRQREGMGKGKRKGKGTGEGYRLQKSGRFAHSREYLLEAVTSMAAVEQVNLATKPESESDLELDLEVEETGREEGRFGYSCDDARSHGVTQGFEVLNISSAIPRYDKGQPVLGLLAVLRKAAAANPPHFYY